MSGKRIKARREKEREIRKAITNWWHKASVLEKAMYLFNFKRFEKKMLRKYFFQNDAEAVKKFAR